MALGNATVIGFMTDWLDPGYQQIVLHGAVAGARERNFKLIAYVTNSPFGVPLQVASTHQLVDPGYVNGLLIMAPSLCWGTAEEQERVLQLMSSIAKCFIAAEVPLSSSILVDNQSGLRLVIQHLIRDHQLRRLAFVRGPEFNVEAEQRLDCYRSTLSEAGLNVDEKLILPGDFSPQSGARAVDILLKERQVAIASVDGIVAANDSMAMGVMEALAARGIRVPKDVAVTGFDDWTDARFLRAPLTTARQPLFEQGKLAVRALTEHMRSGEPQRHVMRTELVVRRSCGCSGGMERYTEVQLDSVRNITSFDAAMLRVRQSLLSDLTRMGRGGLGMLGAGWELRLVSSLVEELKARSSDSFRMEFEGMLQKLMESGADPVTFHEFVSLFWRNLVPCCSADPELRSRLEVCLDDARCATAAAVQRQQGAALVNHRNKAFAFMSACAVVSEVASLEQLGRVLEDHASEMGITHLDLALYPQDQQTEDAVRVLTYSGGHTRRLSSPIRARDLPNIVLREQDTLQGILVTTLELQGETLGLIATNLGAGDGQLFHPIRTALGTALMGIRLRERLQHHGG